MMFTWSPYWYHGWSIKSDDTPQLHTPMVYKVKSTLLQVSWHWRGGWSAPRPGCFTPRKDPVPTVQEAGWAPGPVCTRAKNLAPNGIWSPDHPARSQSLYRLSYPHWWYILVEFPNFLYVFSVQDPQTDDEMVTSLYQFYSTMEGAD
jgi:hypothetical protein